MSFNSALLDSGQIYLDVTAPQRDRIWAQSQALATPASRWTAYLHGLAISALMPWLEEEGLTPRFNQAAANHQWELVGGAVVEIGPRSQRRRLVIVASEQLDLEDWTVPQEWVDSPAMAADYVIAVQVNPDGNLDGSPESNAHGNLPSESSVRLMGFTTQQRLKAQAQLDLNQRTYSLDQECWFGDLGLLPLSVETASVTQTEPSALPELSVAAADSLIERLATPTKLEPRLEIPFERWAALLAHGGWQQQLAERRRGQDGQRSIVDWVRSGLSNLGLSEGWSMAQPNLIPAMAGVRRLVVEDEVETAPVGLARSLTIEQQAYQLKFIALDLDKNRWRIELCAGSGEAIPTGWALRVFSENLQDFEGNQDLAQGEQTSLYLDLELAPGEGIVWETTPHSDGYIPEILRF